MQATVTDQVWQALKKKTRIIPHAEVQPEQEEQNEESAVVSLVTKHDNGTLNLWELTFADQSKFSQVLSIGHRSRASGHRFRVNDITCHPVLPLLLTTSHHNIIEQNKNQNKVNFQSLSEFRFVTVHCRVFAAN
jgi:hypothetical protein